MNDDDLPLYWVLEGHTPVPVRDIRRWYEFSKSAEPRRVAETYVGKVWLSTVFLTLDHNWRGPNHPPVLFETMVFGGGELNEAQMRYSTWEEAEAGHQDMLEVVQAYVDRMQRYDSLRLHDRYLRFPKPKRAPAWSPCSFL